jgi:hypothetical protein
MGRTLRRTGSCGRDTILCPQLMASSQTSATMRNHYSYAVQTESIPSISPPSVTAAGFEAEESSCLGGDSQGG